MSSELIHLSSVTLVEEIDNDGIPNFFRSGILDECANKGWTHGVDEQTFDDSVFDSLSSK